MVHQNHYIPILIYINLNDNALYSIYIVNNCITEMIYIAKHVEFGEFVIHYKHRTFILYMLCLPVVKVLDLLANLFSKCPGYKSSL